MDRDTLWFGRPPHPPRRSRVTNIKRGEATPSTQPNRYRLGTIALYRQRPSSEPFAAPFLHRHLIHDPFALWPSFLFSRNLLLAELLEHLMQEPPLLLGNLAKPLAELLDHAQIVLLPLPQPATPRGPHA